MSRIQELEDNKVLLQRLEHYDVEIAELKEEIKKSTENSDWWIVHLRSSTKSLWKSHICAQFMVVWAVCMLLFIIWDPFGSD